jgi:hypothetical protein
MNTNIFCDLLAYISVEVFWRSHETLVKYYQIKRCHIGEDSILHNRHREFSISVLFLVIG